MTLGPGPGDAVGGYGNMRASAADRERAIDVLKAAFAEGRLSREEHEARVERAYRSRTYADLAALTADLPAGPLGTLHRRLSPRRRLISRRRSPVGLIRSRSHPWSAGSSRCFGNACCDHPWHPGTPPDPADRRPRCRARHHRSRAGRALDCSAVDRAVRPPVTQPCTGASNQIHVHPRVAMHILPHSQVTMMMIFSEVPTAKTRSALKQLAGSWMASVAVRRPDRADPAFEIGS